MIKTVLGLNIMASQKYEEKYNIEQKIFHDKLIVIQLLSYLTGISSCVKECAGKL